MTSGFPRSSISCSDSESSSNEFPTIRRNQSIQEFEAIGECEDIVNQEKEKEKEVERPIEIEFKELKEEDLNQILNQEKLKNQTLLSIKQSLNQVLNQIDLNYLNRSNLLEEHQRRIHHERLQCQFRSNEISGQNLLLDEFKKLRKIEVLDFKEELKKVENELMSQESDYLKERFKILQESNYLNQTINKLKNEISLRKSMIKRFKEQKLIHVQNEVIEEINKLKSSNQSKQNQLYTLKDQLQLQKSTKPH
ncbi:hypothetical protein DFH28DRAFT_629454 [Melampsora americana]|nr:hypothetical protein DFH28DRAFT_629454 [Melampsora americana]